MQRVGQRSRVSAAVVQLPWEFDRLDGQVQLRSAELRDAVRAGWYEFGPH